MEAQVVWLDLLSGEFATCLELKSRTWRDFRGLSGLRPLAPLSARRGLECIKHGYRALGGGGGIGGLSLILFLRGKGFRKS